MLVSVSLWVPMNYPLPSNEARLHLLLHYLPFSMKFSTKNTYFWNKVHNFRLPWQNEDMKQWIQIFNFQCHRGTLEEYNPQGNNKINNEYKWEIDDKADRAWTLKVKAFTDWPLWRSIIHCRQVLQSLLALGKSLKDFL